MSDVPYLRLALTACEQLRIGYAEFVKWPAEWQSQAVEAAAGS